MSDNEMNPNNERLSEYMEQILTTTQDAKTALCEHEGGPADGVPLMMWVTEEHGIAVCPLPVPEADGVSMPQIMDYALRKAFVELGKPMFGAFIAEALIRQGSEQDLSNFRRGDLQREFQKNPMAVTECMTVLVFDGAGKMRHAVISYKYNDKGMPVYDKPQYNEHEVHGAVADAIDGFFEVFVRGW